MSSSKSEIPIIYILSSSHSGSTLLDLLLGSHSQIESTGELERIHRFTAAGRSRDGVDRRCLCGDYLEQCSLWGTAQNAAELYTKDGTGVQSGAFSEFDPENPLFLKAVLDITAKNYLCDSSKNIDRLMFYLDRPEYFSVFVVHLVRDGRAVAHSEERKGRSFFKYLRKWAVVNSRYRRELNSWRARSIVIRYEDLCDKPETTLQTILNQIGLVFELDQLDFRQYTHHNISGNRMRAGSSTEIRRDDSYLSQLGLKRQVFSRLVAGKALKSFGY